MKREQENVSKIIQETVSLLCRNGLTHSLGVRIQGLIGVTVDDSDVFLVQIDDSYATAVNSSVHSSQPDSEGGLLEGNGTVEPTVHRRKTPSKTRRKSAAMMSSAVAGPELFVADTDVITIADELNDDDVKCKYDSLQYNDDTDTKPDTQYDAVSDGQSYDVAWNSHTVKSERTKLAAKDFSSYGDGDENESGFVESENAAQMEPESFTTDQNPQPAWLSQAYSYEQMTVQSTFRQHAATMRHHVKQEYRNQPAWHIARRYRQRQQHQQQQDATDMMVTRSWSLHECGYPDCGRQFRHRRHLLRHQTEKHGRRPTRVLRMQKVWVKPDDLDDGGNY